MARARLLKPGFFSNETLTEIHPFGRLLFAGLWTIADREGRLVNRPKWIKGQLFPYENVPVLKLIKELEGLGFIACYEVLGEAYIEIVNFKKHQHVHVNEGASTLPAPYLHRAPLDIVETNPSEAKAEAKAVSNTEAEADSRALSNGASRVEFHPTTEPPWPDEEEEVGFASQYVLAFRRRTGRDHPGASVVADCKQLERDFGLSACVQMAADLDWEKPPNYMRPKLLERQRLGVPVAAGPKRKSDLWDNDDDD